MQSDSTYSKWPTKKLSLLSKGKWLTYCPEKSGGYWTHYP